MIAGVKGESMGGKRGFTLIELIVVIAVLGLLATLMVGMSASLISQQRLQTTRARLANIDTALVLHVTQYKRLPCPADGTVDSTLNNAGVERATVGPPRTCDLNQRDGVVPWRALGLTAADIEDGWGTRFTYRVGPDLVVDNAMDFSSCDPAGTGPIPVTTPPFCNAFGSGGANCNAANLGQCTPPIGALACTAAGTKGLLVENVAGTVLMETRCNATSDPTTGAAYVVISHGAEGGGGYNAQGRLQSSSTAPGTSEAMNFANLQYLPPPVWPAAPTSFLVDDVYMAPIGVHFDDIVSRPSILAVATKAQIGPRAH